MDDVARLRQQLDLLKHQLEQSEARFRGLIVRNADAIVLVDADGVVRFANPAAEQLFGRPAEDLVGTPFGFPLVSGETTELDIVAGSGRALVAEMRVVVTDWEGSVAYLATLRDITERKRAEQARVRLLREQAARAEAEAAVRVRDEFLSVAAHELRTPITTIRASAQLVLRQIEGGYLDPERLHRRLAMLDRQAVRLNDLIQQLLDMSQIQAGQLTLKYELIDIVELVEQLVAAAQTTTAQHTLVVNAPVQLEAEVDPLRLEQVVANLVDNAIKYSPDGGTIEIGVEAGPDESVLVTVTDHGIGIRPEYRGGLFDRFHSAHRDDHRSGLGLGLFLARQIVDLHHGRIWAEFPPEGGSRFVVSLPRGFRGGEDARADQPDPGGRADADLE